MKRIRTITEAANEIKSQDENTAVTAWSIRQAIKDGSLKFTKSKSRYYVTIEDVQERFGGKVTDNGK